MLIKHTKNIKEKKAPPIALKRVAENLNKGLHTYADYLQRRTERLSISKKRLGLFIFCALFGTMSLCIIVKAFSSRENNFSVHPITFPANMDKPNNDLLSEQPIIPEREFYNIELFKDYMDSLQNTASGKYLYDSIMKARPHLIDSILLLEHMYLTQSSKK